MKNKKLVKLESTSHSNFGVYVEDRFLHKIFNEGELNSWDVSMILSFRWEVFNRIFEKINKISMYKLNKPLLEENEQTYIKELLDSDDVNNIKLAFHTFYSIYQNRLGDETYSMKVK